MNLDDIQQQLNDLQDAELNKFEKQIVKALQKVQTLVDVNLLEDIKNPLEYDYKMQQYLNEAGYYKAVNNLVDNSFDVVYSGISDAFAVGGISVVFGETDLVKINSLKQLTFDKYNALANESISTLKSNLYKYSLSNATAKDIANEMRTALDGSGLAKYSKTYAETSINDYTQSIIDLKASDTSEGVWIYKGVSDLKTRPFCQHILNVHKAYDDKEKLKLQNDPKRRWNCRHHFWKVTQEYAESKGFMEGKAKATETPVVEVPKISFGYGGKFDKYVEDIRDEAKIVIDKLPKPGIREYGDKPYYTKDQITIPEWIDNKSVFLHEYGHHIDKEIKYISQKIFEKSFDIDLKNKDVSLFDNFLKDNFYKIEQYERNDKIRTRLKETKEQSGLVSDIFDAMTKGTLTKINPQLNGHGTEYFRVNGVSQEEVFANLFSIYSTDKKVFEKLKEVIPETSKEFEKIITKIINN